MKSYGRVQKGQGFETPEIDDGYYRGMVKLVEEKTGSYQGEEYDQFQIRWELTEVPSQARQGSFVEITSWVRIPDGIHDGVLNENSKLYELLIALGYSDEDLEIVPDEWHGKECRLHIENKVLQEGKNKGESRAKVQGYKPLQARGPKRGEQPAEKREPVAASKGRAAAAPADDF